MVLELLFAVLCGACHLRKRARHCSVVTWLGSSIGGKRHDRGHCSST